MRTLFLKIFFCFLVIIVLVGTSLETSSILARFYEDRWQVTLHSIMPMEAEKSAKIYETSGKDTLQTYLDELQTRKTALLLLRRGRQLARSFGADVVRRLAAIKKAWRERGTESSAVNVRRVSP